MKGKNLLLVVVCLSILSFFVYKLEVLDRKLTTLPWYLENQKQQADSQTAPPRYTKMPIVDFPRMGADTAKVKMIVFIDYQCPYCEQFYKEVYPHLMKHYVKTGKLQIIFQDKPLPSHKYAQQLASYAHASFKNNSLDVFLEDVWSYNPKDESFKTNYGAQNETIEWHKSFTEKMQTSKLYSQIAGVVGTPSFIVNNRLLGGFRSSEDLSKLIEFSFKNTSIKPASENSCGE